MEESYRYALFEVYCIIEKMQEYNKEKIPLKFIEFIEKNKKYNSLLNSDEISLENSEKLSKEAKIILSIVYRDYICSKEERKALLKNDEKILEEKYSYNKLFKDNEKTIEINREINEQIVYEEKENIKYPITLNGFKKMLIELQNKIKNILKKFFI